jgi:hypothetical protein
MSVFTVNAQTGTGKRQAADLAGWFRNRFNLLLAIGTPAKSRPVTASTDRREEPVQTNPEPLIETICPEHALSDVLLEILQGSHQP